MQKPIKPLGQKTYGSIPHLPSSRLGPGDHKIEPSQAAIATVKTRDRHDLVIVQEKLDGSNVCVAKHNGQILALTRAGYLATDSPHLQHHAFAKWVQLNHIRFNGLLQEGERVCGEWLAMAHGTLYKLPHEPFVAFDLIKNKRRAPFQEFKTRVERHAFVIPGTLWFGTAFSVESMLTAISKGRDDEPLLDRAPLSFHGAQDSVEGAVWRVERKGEVDFLCKFVQPDKEDGKYFPEKTGKGPIWNCNINDWI